MSILAACTYSDLAISNNDFITADITHTIETKESIDSTLTPFPGLQISINPGTETPNPTVGTPSQALNQAASYMIFLLDNEIVMINPYHPLEIDSLIQGYSSELLLNPRPEKISSDGTKLLISTINAGLGKYRLVIFDLQNNSARPLLNDIADQIYPQWSPNGEDIVLTLRSDEASTLCIVKEDGSSLTKLHGGFNWDRRPFWSPDGERIYFISSDDFDVYPPSEVFAINSDGSNLQKLTSKPYTISDFSLSPDGLYIAFSAPLNSEDIFILKTDGSSIENITNNIYQDTTPVWSPNS